jgi:hypothetical protein
LTQLIGSVLTVEARSQEKTASVAGSVLDETTGLPLSNIQVQIRPGSFKTFSDENGRFSFENLSSGLALIDTKGIGYAPARMKEHKLPGNSGVPIELISGRRLEISIYISRAPVLTGHVVDSQGQPVVGVRVVPYRLTFDDGGMLEPRYFPAATTNDLGVYRSTDLEAGDYFLKFETPTLQSTTALGPFYYSVYYPGTIDAAKAASVVLENGVENFVSDMLLPSAPGGVLTINIVNPVGAVEKGAAVLYLKRRNESGVAQTISAALPPKPIEVGRLAPGKYDVEIYFPMSSARGRSTVDISDSDVRIDMSIEKPVTFSGSITIPGRQKSSNGESATSAIEGIQLRLVPPLALRNTDTYYVSEKDGSLRVGNSALALFSGLYNVRVTNVPSGLYVSEVMATGSNGNQVIFDSGDGQQSIDVQLGERPALIEGNVIDKNGRSASNAVVALVPDDPVQLYRSVSFTTDIRGHYEIQAAPGAYHIYAWIELEGMAYRNSEFIKSYQERGQVLHVGVGDHIAKVDLQALD